MKPYEIEELAREVRLVGSELTMPGASRAQRWMSSSQKMPRSRSASMTRSALRERLVARAVGDAAGALVGEVERPEDGELEPEVAPAARQVALEPGSHARHLGHGTHVRTYDGFTPDLVVVGGGMGGISATLRAAHLGARVLLVEPAALGGT